jgi:hypothetical protein
MGEWRDSSIIFSSALDDEWSASQPGLFNSWEIAPGTHWIEGWVGPSAGLDTMEKRLIFILLGIRNVGEFVAENIIHDNLRSDDLKS